MKLFILYLLLTINAFADVGEFSLKSEKTLYIVDGDSISMQMRIAGIDTPEMRQKCRKTQDEVINCGRISKKYLQKILQSLPGELHIEPVGIDHYQRILVRVYKGDVNIAKLMVEAGMAFSYKNTYKTEEDVARELRLGFWNFHTPPIEPYKWRRLNKN